MQSAIEKLRKFHEKHRFPLDKNLSDYQNETASRILQGMADEIFQTTTTLECFMKNNMNELRLHRAHLILEEAAESLVAMARNDETELMDGLSDLMFVTIGTSESFGLPTRQGLMEVCYSNLTKAVRKKEDVRLRDKGDSFIPPNMKRILEQWRNQKE